MLFTEENPGIFWLPEAPEKVKGGYFVRNPLKEFIKALEDKGEKVAAIKFDGSYNLEILVELNGTEEGD